jgi:carbon monoxide dehydrogenase subunit G
MKQISLRKSWIIKAPREAVYKIMSDFENMPKNFPAVAKSMRILNREGNNLLIDARAKTFGRLINVRMKTELCPPLGYISDNESGIGTSGHEEFLMEEITEGTKINYTYNVQIKNPILRIFGKILIEKYAMRVWERAVINKLKKMLEN